MHIIQAPETSFNLTKYQNCLRITTPFTQYTFLPRPFIPISSVNPLKALGIDPRMLRDPIYDFHFTYLSNLYFAYSASAASHTLYHVYPLFTPFRPLRVLIPL